MLWLDELGLGDNTIVFSEKLAELQEKFMEVWRGIEAEGPRDWWENEPERNKKDKKRGKSKDKAETR